MKHEREGKRLASEIHRLVPDIPFPPYAYTGAGSGLPHPRFHPQGHSHGKEETQPPPLDPARWQESRAYLFGFDLFNHGFYWEAHEEWEGLWVAAGKTGPVSEFLKGLIKLAAAGVKARQGNAEGVRRHAERAAGHFQETARQAESERFAGFTPRDLIRFALEIGRRAGEWQDRARPETARVFDRDLIPSNRP